MSTTENEQPATARWWSTGVPAPHNYIRPNLSGTLCTHILARRPAGAPARLPKQQCI